MYQIGLDQGQPALIPFYDRKVNPIGEKDAKISGVRVVPDIKVVD